MNYSADYNPISTDELFIAHFGCQLFASEINKDNFLNF